MADLPKYTDFFSTVLSVLSSAPTGLRRKEIKNLAADAAALTDEQKRMTMPDGRGPLFENRIGWAVSYLAMAGLLESPSRGTWKLTNDGAKLVAQYPRGLPASEVSRIDSLVRKEYRQRRNQANAAAEETSTPEVTAGRSPEEVIHAAVGTLEDAVAEELLQSLVALSDQRFEIVVLDVLRGMGYAWDASGVRHTGRTGDGGIDGVIDMDPLGIQRVYVQAKKWTGSVGVKEVQAFVGSLAGFQARMGVFITSSDFTKQALEFESKTSDKLVLINGNKLVRLMIQHGVGVSHQNIRLPRVDGDYFE